MSPRSDNLFQTVKVFRRLQITPDFFLDKDTSQLCLFFVFPLSAHSSITPQLDQFGDGARGDIWGDILKMSPRGDNLFRTVKVFKRLQISPDLFYSTDTSQTCVFFIFPLRAHLGITQQTEEMWCHPGPWNVTPNVTRSWSGNPRYRTPHLKKMFNICFWDQNLSTNNPTCLTTQCFLSNQLLSQPQ